jgi:hypothetical protein
VISSASSAKIKIIIKKRKKKGFHTSNTSTKDKLLLHGTLGPFKIYGEISRGNSRTIYFGVMGT